MNDLAKQQILLLLSLGFAVMYASLGYVFSDLLDNQVYLIVWLTAAGAWLVTAFFCLLAIRRIRRRQRR